MRRNGTVVVENCGEMMMTKAARRRTENVLTMPPVESATAMAIASGATESDIARRAFELHCDRGRVDGHDVDDWLSAEHELRDAPGSSAA